MPTELLSYWFPLLTDNSPFLFAILDEKHNYKMVNSRYCEISGYNRDELIGKNDSEVLGAHYYQSLAPYYTRAFQGEQVEAEINLGEHHFDSSFYFSVTPLQGNSDEAPTAIILHGVDTSERQILLSSLEEAENQLRALTQLTSDGICITEGSHILKANQQAIQLLGVSPKQDLQGQSLGRYLIDPQTRRVLDDQLNQIPTGEVKLCQTSPHAKQQRLLEVTATDISLMGAPAKLVKLVEKKLPKAATNSVQIATKDPLTGLMNRHGFSLQLEQMIQTKKSLQMLYIDVDNFKNINDSLGHHIGDRVLKEIAIRLQQLLPPNAVLGHLGGDEFGVILPNPEHERSAQVLAQEIIALVNSPFDLLHFSKHLACSIGVVNYPAHGKDARALMQNADTAMYEAKTRGRNRFVCFDIQMSKDARVRLWLEIELQKAIKNHTLEVWYQPKVDARSFAICGAEALVRWKHPVEGYISPAQFIPVAERSGLIEQLGLVVIREVFRSVRQWRQNKILPGRIAINLSPQQFGNPNLIKDVKNLIDDEQVTPSDITFELTESAVMSDGEHAIQMLNAIKRLGAALSIDDFGTGYSSLAYLTRFPLDELKIDRAFIKDLDTLPKQATLVESIIHLGKSMDMQIVAEGVETLEQATLLANLQCHAIQGFHFYKPMPRNEFESLLLENIGQHA
ncbi:sensor domain-containing protein [Thaumasiovibrio subtropicus]|uniref:sensor domain-containing protein n=1 Tax=Thaumasiovibrio subtropicus TaxID=1891207 RepID=UPI000B34ED3B|nr:EAL domain-containing protein [Thaumasiovibrio subtropicus]